MSDPLDIHAYARFLEKKCELGPGIGACYASAMSRTVECVKGQNKSIDSEMMKNGMQLVTILFNMQCDSESKTNFIQYSQKLGKCEESGFEEITRCIKEMDEAQVTLYGYSLSMLQYVDATKCRAMKRYQNCILKEWEKCDSDNSDIDLRTKAKISMDQVHYLIGCSSDDEAETGFDERFYQLMQIKMCKASTVSQSDE